MDIQDARVNIRIGRLRVLENSPLLNEEYDNADVFIEWNFLDFNRELCETMGTLKLPRKSTDICDFDTERGSFFNLIFLFLLKFMN